jgi:glutamyl/glutaminyl-tRNA synthetase
VPLLQNPGSVGFSAGRKEGASSSWHAESGSRLIRVGGAGSTSSSTYRGRIAPSPTGFLHVGHARTFWTAFARARAAGGVLVLRMEDLDAERSRAAYAEAAIEDLHWLGIEWQEGPGNLRPGSKRPGSGPGEAGPYGPYAQSERGALYLAAWRRLVEGGFLFPCRCSRKDLAAALSAPHESDAVDDEPLYPGTCRALRAAEFWTGEAASGVSWRFRVPDGEAIEFVDGNLGPQRFQAGVDFGDFLVWRRDGVASYQLACVVDDAAMRITEVVRGADLLKSTARQILLNRALGYANPAWFHCAVVLDAQGRRLAKRHDALSVRALRERGLGPEAIVSTELRIEE